jgi:hypothetical protein
MEESKYIVKYLRILLKLEQYFKKKEWLDVNGGRLGTYNKKS